MGMLKTREGEPEVIEPVRQGFARNGDAKRRHVGEVGQTHAARRVLLAEHHIAARTMKRPPSRDAALQGPAHPGGELRMAPADLLEHRDGAQAGSGRKHRHDLALPHAGERVGTAALPRLLLVRWQPRIGFDPIGGSRGKPRLRGGDGGDVGVTGLHVQPRLAVGDVSARQALILLLMKNQMLRPTTPTARRRPSLVRSTLGENAPPGMG
jgi:hypothetical protein